VTKDRPQPSKSGGCGIEKAKAVKQKATSLNAPYSKKPRLSDIISRGFST
jgi:hypothetical protein